MDAVLMSGDALVTDEYWEITGDAGAGTLMTFSPDPRKSPDASRGRRGVARQGHRAGRLRPLHLRRRPGLGAGGRDGRSRPSTTRSSRRSTTGTFKTVLGTLEFDDKGDVSLPGYVFYEWKDGKYDEM